ncbi:MAG: hypothetical protein JAY74_21555 [Candidatus Thiodiazotropha taylori]|nr:hypothetical protein [Candidatus Thiodiazotropha taylori]RLW62970.1 MAG: hypothetical protein B6D73_17670 [gamma proteobacterium symbiont of Stewartia floridana]
MVRIFLHLDGPERIGKRSLSVTRFTDKPAIGALGGAVGGGNPGLVGWSCPGTLGLDGNRKLMSADAVRVDGALQDGRDQAEFSASTEHG